METTALYTQKGGSPGPAPEPTTARVGAATPRYVLALSEVSMGSVGVVGGKNASLGELIRELGPLGIRIPNGFAITADAYRLHLGPSGAPTGSRV